MAISKGELYIGTSNIVLPGAKHTFPLAYQKESRLRYYSSLFKTVEINSTFYKLPLYKTLERWASDVPDDFKFSVKLSKSITHSKGLNFDVHDIDRFLEVVDGIGLKKGCLLIQFPGSITAVYSLQVKKILQRLVKGNARQWNLCVEFRHNSWYGEHSMKRWFKAKHISIVVHDKPKSQTPLGFDFSDVVYARYHGPHGDYRGGYSNEFLHDHAEVIQQWRAEGKTVYVYFNNSMGQAFENAEWLRDACDTLRKNKE